MKGKIKLVVGLVFATAVAVQAAPIFVENFDNLDPTTDTTGSGSTILGGQGQLEDITGTTWGGRDTNGGNLQTRVIPDAAGDRNLNIRTHSDATTPQINNTATFTTQDQASAFGLYFNLESWGTDNNGAGNDKYLGRTEIGVRNSAGANVFGIEIAGKYLDATSMFMSFYDYTSGTRTQIGGESNKIKGGGIGSIGFAYDGAGNMILTAYDGADQTGNVLMTTTGATSGSAFSADSIYIMAAANNTGKARIQNIQVDDITVTAIPEPATLGMVILMGGGLFYARRRRIMR